MADVPNMALCWIDIETTGLDYEDDLILEMAWQFTDYLGEPLSELDSTLVITDVLKEKVLERYGAAHPAVRQMHLNNGLWNECVFDETVPRTDFFTAIEKLYIDADSIRERYPEVEIRFAGSSVQFDKRFIETVSGEELTVSYRIHDLSTLKPFLTWQGFDLDELIADVPEGNHRAAGDIERDITLWRRIVELLTE